MYPGLKMAVLEECSQGRLKGNTRSVLAVDYTDNILIVFELQAQLYLVAHWVGGASRRKLMWSFAESLGSCEGCILWQHGFLTQLYSLCHQLFVLPFSLGSSEDVLCSTHSPPQAPLNDLKNHFYFSLGVVRRSSPFLILHQGKPSPQFAVVLAPNKSILFREAS